MTDLLVRRDEASVGYDLERLKPDVTQLCRAVSSIPVATARERLAQSEIAKKVFFLKIVISFFPDTLADFHLSRWLT